MKGIRFVVDDDGQPQAVQIDLKQHGRLWEDIQDILVSRARRQEPRIPWQKMEAELRKMGKLK